MSKIELHEGECNLIYEALITEISEQADDNDYDKRRGRNITRGERRLDELRLLKLKVEAYAD